ncbi:MAG: peptidoglycan-binding domain-containing protein, partial [Nocardioidaceae bacterium]
VNGRFGRGSYRAVRRLQHAHPALPVTGTMNRRTWTALLTTGSTPLLKYGWANDAVRRVQRGLNAARKERLDVDGIFGADVRAAVKRYQHEHGLRRTGVVTDQVWWLLQHGRR